MGVPRAHSTRGQKGRRRSHLALQASALSSCEHCHKLIIPHTVCKLCGFYRGREVVNVLAQTLKKQEKQKQTSR